MNQTLQVTGYDLSDEGPGRTVNEDATLVRPDLGLFAVADGAGGRGKGNVAASLALRTIENYVGATVRRTHERPDYDVLGIPEQAKRLSAAVHQAHANVREVVSASPDRKGMATTVVALLFAPRTGLVHIAHVGDSRCYRLRRGRLETMTEDHTVATDLLERRPDVPDEVLAQLPRNSVVRALGMDEECRVAIRTLEVAAGDRFLLCSDGLSSAVPFGRIAAVMSEPVPAGVLASELLSHALANHSQDNISVLVVDVDEEEIDESVSTRRYNERPLEPPSSVHVESDALPNSAELHGPEVLHDDVIGSLDSWTSSLDDAETLVRETDEAIPHHDISEHFRRELVRSEPSDPLLEPSPTTQSSPSMEPAGPVSNSPIIDLDHIDPEAFDRTFDEARSYSEPPVASGPIGVEIAEVDLDFVDDVEEFPEDASERAGYEHGFDPSPGGGGEEADERGSAGDEASEDGESKGSPE